MLLLLKRVVNIIGPDLSCNLQSLSHRHNIASLSLFYKYFNGHCSKELFSLVPPVKLLKRQTRLASRSHQYIVDIPQCKKKRFTLIAFFLVLLYS